MKNTLFTHFFLILLLWLPTAIAQQSAPNSPRPYSDPQRFANAMANFAAMDKESPAPENAIVFVGSSSIRRWNTLTEDMAPLTVINRGFGGSNMHDALDHIEQTVLRYKPRAVVLYEGDNDLSSFKATPAMVMEAFTDFTDRLYHRLPQTRLYVLSIKPSLSRMDVWPTMQLTNQQLVKACTVMSKCEYIDVATPMFSNDGGLSKSLFVEDDLHMTPAGYKIWTDAIKPVLMKNELTFESE